MTHYPKGGVGGVVGELLVREQLISLGVLRRADQQARASGKTLAEVLVDQGHISDDALVEVVAKAHQLLAIPKLREAVQKDAVTLIAEDIARRFPLSAHRGRPER